jgi:hypothetical protein
MQEELFMFYQVEAQFMLIKVIALRQQGLRPLAKAFIFVQLKKII